MKLLHFCCAIGIIFVLSVTFGMVYAESPITFTDVTKMAGVERPMDDQWGSVFADFNNDGFLDLYVTAWNSMNPLYINNGDGTFSEKGQEWGIFILGGLNTTAADYDNDGNIDLYITTQVGPNQLFHNNGDGTFSEVGKEAGVNLSSNSWGAVFFDYNNDGLLDLYVITGVLGADRSVLYRNMGNGKFEDVTKQAGLEHMGGGIFIAIGDYDGDGYIDLFYGDYLNFSGIMWHNNGNGTFTDVSKDLAFMFDGNLIVFGDYDNDGDLDARTPKGLYRNDGDGKFTDVTQNSGLNTTEASVLADFDNDGWLDVLDRIGTRLYLYINNGDGTFREVTNESGLKVSGMGSNLLSYPVGDYDNDGFLDIYTCYAIPGGGLAGPNELWHNNGNKNNWLHLRLVGTKSNRNAVGAKVKLTADGMTQFREVGTGGHSYSQDTFDVEFGLGKSSIADNIEIKWPSGIVTRLSNIQCNQKLTVVEPESNVVNPEGKLTGTWGKVKADRLYQNYPNPFNPETWIPYELAEDSKVTIKIYNVNGQVITTLDIGYKKAGLYMSRNISAYWDGMTDYGEIAPSGVYFYDLQAKSHCLTKKMSIIR